MPDILASPLVGVIYNQDCFDAFPAIPDHSISLILCDPPYGVTAKNQWDKPLPFDRMWQEYERVIKDDGVIILFAQGMFAHKLAMSNEKLYRYSLVWDKVLPSGFLNANRQPLRTHEDILVFYKKPPVYHPQKFIGAPSHSKGKAVGQMMDDVSRNSNYHNHKVVQTEGDQKFPGSILRFQKPHPSIALHPTQKPVELLRFLIRSYTDEGQTVLDNCMGSGSTGVAALQEGRSFIGMELNKEYCDIAVKRLKSEGGVTVKFPNEINAQED